MRRPGYSPSCSPDWLQALLAEYRPAAPFVPHPHELGAPDAWLYVSKRLALEWLPNVPLWSPLVLTLGSDLAPVAYYRLTPGVLHWLDVAGRVLEQGYEAGTVSRDQVEAYAGAMGAVWAFAARHLDPTGVDAAKDREPALPDVPYVPLDLYSPPRYRSISEAT